MSTHTASARPMVAPVLPRWARLELGVRNAVLWTSREVTGGAGVAWTCTIGAFHATADVRIVLNALDLYEVTLPARRGARAQLAHLCDVHAEDLPRALVEAWCVVCATKGW